MAEKHFHEQRKHTESYLIPYFEKHLAKYKKYKILEIGCAEGGFLDVLHGLGVTVVGLELSATRAQLANDKNPALKVCVGDITDPQIADQIGERFDLVVMRDTIEHVPARTVAFTNIRKLLRENGYLYITFPPRFSAFAGHQQVGKSALRILPFVHCLPNMLIRALGRIFKERPSHIDFIILNYEVGLSIRAFDAYCSQFRFKVVVRDLFISRPIYSARSGLRTVTIPNIPLLREFTALGCECLLQKCK